MPTYKEWEIYFEKLPDKKLLQYVNAIEVLMNDPMIHKSWGEFTTLSVLLENEINRRKRATKKEQRPIITGSFKSKRKSK